MSLKSKLFQYSIFINFLFAINPPQSGSFPLGFWNLMEEQDIGNTYGDSGWVRKLAYYKSNTLRDAQLEFNLPVLLGKYSGATTYFNSEDFQNTLFDNNTTGTMTDYYQEISHGNFIIDGTAEGWYQSSYTMGQAKENTKQYVSEIAEIADPDFDYGQYDNDGPDNIPNSGDDDGYVDGLAVVYSGCGAEWGNGNGNLWPHMSTLGSDYQYTTQDASSNGGYIIVNSYFVAPELAGGGDCYTDIIRPMGVYAHEFGHILGLPDLYDRNSDNGSSEGIGNWCLMAGGSWNGWAGDTPAHLSAWCKQEMGWIDPLVLENNQIGLEIPYAEESAFALKVWEDDYQSSRYFLVENRQQTGFDVGLPGNGLIVYHVDENKRWGTNRWSSGTVNDDHTHKFIDVEAADGNLDMDNGLNRGDGGDPFPGSDNNINFSFNTNPNSNRYSGELTSVELINISGSSNTMIADISLESKKGLSIVYDPTGISGWGWGYSSPSDSWGGVLFEYSSDEADNGYITEVDLGFKTNSNSYDLFIYDSFDGASPGTLLHEQSGTYNNSGWLSVPIDSILIQPGQEFFIACKLSNQAYAISFDKTSVPTNRSFFSGDGSNFDGTIGESYNINIRAKLHNQNNNEAPIVVNQSITTDEDIQYSGTLTGSDQNNDALTFLIATNPINGMLILEDASNGSYTYIPNENYNGEDNFTFTANDDELTSEPATVLITISPINDGPVVSESTLTINEDSIHNGSLIGNDIDGDALMFTVASFPSSGTVIITDATIGGYLYTPNENYNGSDSFTFNASDGELSSESGTVNITIDPVEDYPIVMNNSFESDEDMELNGVLEGEDFDGDDIIFQIETEAVNGSVTIQNSNTGEFTYVPNANFYGDDAFTFSAVKESGGLEYVSEAGTIYISMLPINDAPNFETMEDLSIDEDNTLAIQLSAMDVDGDYLLYEVELVEHIDAYIFNSNNLDSLLLVPEPNWSGTAEISIHVEDESGESDNTLFILTVNPVDDDPFLDGYIDDIYLIEDFEDEWSLDLDESFEDIDGDLIYSVTFQNNNVINAIIEGSMLTLEAIENSNGETNMFVTASNPTRASVTDTVFIRVFEENDEPILTQLESITIDEDESYIFPSMEELMENGTLVDVDTDLEDLDFEYVSDSEQVQVEWDGNPSTQPIFIPDENYSGSAIITLWVYDAFYWVYSDVDITINPVNDVPFFVSEMHAPVGLSLEFSIPLHAEDIDSEEITVILTAEETNPSWVSIDENTLYGIPNELGMFPVYLSLSDGEITISDTFNLHVENFTPEITSIMDVPNDQGGRVYVSFNSSFFDNDNENINTQMYSLFRYDLFENDSSGWVLVESGGAIADESYTYEGTTLTDSLSVTNNGHTEFKVVASMMGGIFHSEPVMGYSIDNIAPGVPEGLMAIANEYDIQLSWNHNSEEDFQYYIIEKSMDANFIDPETYQVSDSSFIDADYVSNQAHYYRLIAVDYAGNYSDCSEVVEATILSINGQVLPEEFSLHQNYPNPFNPTTKIKYDLPKSSTVNIDIYDLIGRSIKSLVNKKESAGFRSVRWNATNNYGEAVSAGIYIYVIQAGEFRATKKMVLLK